MGIKLKDVIEYELVSEELLDCIITECPVCGEEIEFDRYIETDLLSK